MLRLYGIKNCDTVKKARTWLDQNDHAYTFCDLRADVLTPELLRSWCQEIGWEQVLNKRSTTWRQLPDSSKHDLDETGAIALMLETPTLIKRPVLTLDSRLGVGFNPTLYQQLLGIKG